MVSELSTVTLLAGELLPLFWTLTMDGAWHKPEILSFFMQEITTLYVLHIKSQVDTI